MKTQKLLIVSLAIVVGAAIAGIMIANRKTERAIEPVRVNQPAKAPAPVIAEPTPPAEMSVPETRPEPQPPKAGVPAKAQNESAQVAPPANSGELEAPDLRAALSLVGADPVAEQYWKEAIFDPSLSDKDREDLMEDLNEEGLSDPKHPSPEDLPLILNRLAIIEEVAPYADEFMLEHLGEAYKDLNNLLAGKEVQ